MRTDDPGFKPNMWVDVTKYLDQKIEIMKIYNSELDLHPFPRSTENIKYLAKFRGSNVNVDSAESFMMIKDIS